LKNVLKIDQNVQAAMLVTSVAAIMANVPELKAQFLKDIIEALSKVLDINHRTLLNEITSKLPLNNEQQSNNVELIDEEMTDETEDDAAIRRLKEDLPSDLDVEKKTVGNLLSAQRIAVEVISNICTNDDEEMKSDMVDDDSDAESVHDYDVNGGEQQVSADKIPIEIVEAIKAHQIVNKIWLRAQPLPENVNQILSDVEKNLSKRAKLLRVSSIICLQNLCSCMTTDELGGVQAIYDVWLNLGQQIFTVHQQETDVVESSTSLMRATLEHLRKSPEFFKSMNESDLQLILEGVEKCDAIETRANWLRMLGTLGCLLREDLVRKVVNFLLECTYKEEDVWTMSETLDSFMDMFSDNDWNQIVVDLNVVGKSKELEKILKTKVNSKNSYFFVSLHSIFVLRF
jgi:HEAT repeat-containing protein 3